MEQHPSGIPHLDVDDTHRRQRAGEITLVDVRMPDEWAQTGTPVGSVRATLQDPEFLAHLARAVDNDLSARIAFSCAVGGRSLQAAIVARQNGYQTVYNVDGGFAAWHASELPVD